MVLDAVDSVGLRGDGRLLALNSYENRVYRVGREEGQPVVVKFYRPGRWSDAAILEEHAFVQELADQEIPVVPARVLEGRTLHEHGGPRLDAAELRLHLDLAVAMLGLALMMDVPALTLSRLPAAAEASGPLDPILLTDQVVHGFLHVFTAFLALWRAHDFGASLDRLLERAI